MNGFKKKSKVNYHVYDPPTFIAAFKIPNTVKLDVKRFINFH